LATLGRRRVTRWTKEQEMNGQYRTDSLSGERTRVMDPIPTIGPVGTAVRHGTEKITAEEEKAT
jgi:hypothetical protein